MSLYKKIFFTSLLFLLMGCFAVPVSAQSYCWPQKECNDAGGEWTNNTKNQCISDFGFCYPKEGSVTLQIPIGGLKETSSLSQYIPALYNYMVGMVSIVAVVMIMVGGLIYLTAGGNPEKIGKAKDTILGAIIGLILTLGSYTILQTINPALTKVSLPRLKMIAPESITQWCPNNASYAGKYLCGNTYTKNSNPELPISSDGSCTGSSCSQQNGLNYGCFQVRFQAKGMDDKFQYACMEENAGKVLKKIESLVDNCGKFKREACSQPIIALKSTWEKYEPTSPTINYMIGIAIGGKALTATGLGGQLFGSSFYDYLVNNGYGLRDDNSLYIQLCSTKDPNLKEIFSVAGCGPHPIVVPYITTAIINKSQSDPNLIKMLQESLGVK